MTNDQINVAIAEACGWGDVHFSLAATDEFPTQRRVVGIPPKHCTHDVAPNYCTNLNAMHEAEKTLTNANMYVMEVQLKYVLSAGEFYFHATARQRAEAFLRTLGKWKPTTEDSSADQKEVQG